MPTRRKKSIHVAEKLPPNFLYTAKETVGGTMLTQLEFVEDGLIKLKIDEQIFFYLLSKKRYGETIRMAVERAILSMT
jgi:hypothetical protein